MELTNEEKIDIINQHYKASTITSFDIQLNIIEENATGEPNQERLDLLNKNLNIELAKQKETRRCINTRF